MTGDLASTALALLAEVAAVTAIPDSALGSGLRWFLLVALMGLSASFSASETALFVLGLRGRERAGSLVRKLLSKPRPLLTTILLGNLVVNLLFFSFATQHTGAQRGLDELLVGLLVPLLVVLVFGEVLPKTIAMRAPVPIARAAAVPLAVLVPAIGPVRYVVEALLDVTYRALGRVAQRESGVDQEQLEHVLKASARSGDLLLTEAEFLAGVAALDDLRAREIMTPRVDMLLLDRAEDAEDHARVLARAVERKLGWLVVVDGGPDRVVGRVRVRDLLAHPERPLDEQVVPVTFVPEVATALSALHLLREQHTALAVVVDEWGGTAGLVTLEDVLEEVVGELLVEGEELEQPVLDLGGGVFRVSGSLSIRDWNEQFGRRVVPTEFETVAGFVAALAGHVPRAGDRVRTAGLEFTVHELRGRRVATVDVRVERPGQAGPEVGTP